MKMSTLAFLAMAISPWAHAGFSPPAEAPALEERTFTQAVDHNSRISDTFNQRYWIDSEFADSPTSPVLLRICGEVNGEEFIPDATISHARALHAHVIYFEHRDYGSSLATTGDRSNGFPYLTLANILGDLVSFESYARQTLGLSGPWIALGGSYSGTLAALYRFEHPEMVVGALAASAPMREADFSPVGETDDDAQNLIDSGYGRSAWTYESCTQFTFWQADDATSGPIYRPGLGLCHLLFNVTTPVDWQAYNHAYYDSFVTAGPDAASNILFTSGTDDVWSQLTIQAADNHNPLIYTRTIPGAGHHFDLNDSSDGEDTPDVVDARNYFLTLAKQWLGL